MLFQPTRPLRGATAVRPTATAYTANFNPRAPCGARLPATTTSSVVHALFQPTRPLRGATVNNLAVTVEKLYFNPRAPCGARLHPLPPKPNMKRFQPTRPLRGATTCCSACPDAPPNFNPRAPCGARRLLFLSERMPSLYFNPRAPCGARQLLPVIPNKAVRFQPTRPLRGATFKPVLTANMG